MGGGCHRPVDDHLPTNPGIKTKLWRGSIDKNPFLCDIHFETAHVLPLTPFIFQVYYVRE